MATFVPPLGPFSTLVRNEDSIIALPDRDALPGRRLPRHAGATVVMFTATNTSSSAGVTLASPVRGIARRVWTGTATSPPLLEIEPLPFFSPMAAVLRALPGGAPTIYLRGAMFALPDESLVLPGEPLGTTDIKGMASVGVVFQDGVSLSPDAWLAAIEAAMLAAGDSSAAADWHEFGSIIAASDPLVAYRRAWIRVLDHAGRPFPAGESFRFREGPTGAFQGPLSTDVQGRLVLPTTVPGVRPSLFSPATSAGVQLLWQPAGSPLPLYALLDQDLPRTAVQTAAASLTGTVPEERRIDLPANLSRGHLQITDLAQWFAPMPAASPYARWNAGSHVEPLVDGIPTFRRLVADLIASAAAPVGGESFGAHLAGWAFRDFEMDPALTLPTGLTDTRLTSIVAFIRAGGGDVRILVNKMLKPERALDSLADDVKKVAIVVLMVLPEALLLGQLVSFLQFEFKSELTQVFLAASVIAGATILAIIDLHIFLALIESTATLEGLLGLPGTQPLALWSLHPMRLADNPLATVLPLGLQTDLQRFTVWHQKIQLVKKPGPGGTVEHVAYLGGLDLNTDRMDAPGHNGATYAGTEDPEKARLLPAPFHDVHARITGKAASDVFRTFADRYAYDAALQRTFDSTARAQLLDNKYDPTAIPPAAFPPPTPAALPAAGRHLVQIGRTVFGPAVARLPTAPASERDEMVGFPQAEHTINDTLIRALLAARQCIYIEDQYFTPNARSPEPAAGATIDTYFDALIRAATSCARLVILVPSETDQPFGSERRDYLFDRLATAWGDRMMVGSPIRRPVLPTAGLAAHEGRCILITDLGEGPAATGLVIGPKARVPQKPPFWLWVNGELMLATNAIEVSGVVPAVAVTVIRGNRKPPFDLGTSPRQHKQGDAVTLSQLKGIYVHAKVMVVDDVFVSIGSANLNRRGFFSDGEITCFTVPEELRAAADNPARSLRCALWAEHLGLPPAMGATLLADPIASFELFKRTRYQGNRYVPFDQLALQRVLTSLPKNNWILELLELASVGVEAFAPTSEWTVDTFWDEVVDPTSLADVPPVRGIVPRR